MSNFCSCDHSEEAKQKEQQKIGVCYGSLLSTSRTSMVASRDTATSTSTSTSSLFIYLFALAQTRSRCCISYVVNNCKQRMLVFGVCCYVSHLILLTIAGTTCICRRIQHPQTIEISRIFSRVICLRHQSFFVAKESL
jgi:hypothetical protein